MQTQFAEMEQQLAYGWQAFEQQAHQLAAVTSEKAVSVEGLRGAEAERDEARKEMLQLEAKNREDNETVRKVSV